MMAAHTPAAAKLTLIGLWMLQDKKKRTATMAGGGQSLLRSRTSEELPGLLADS
jgi:hypothetical protein